jgi:hypothetical protein
MSFWTKRWSSLAPGALSFLAGACSGDFSALQSSDHAPKFDDDAGLEVVRPTRDASRKDAVDAPAADERVEAGDARSEVSDAQVDSGDAREADKLSDVPTGLRMGPPYPTSQLSPSPGGSNYTDTCPEGHVMIGVNATVDLPDSGRTYLRSVQVICGSPSIAADQGLRVTTTPSVLLPERGAVSNVPQARWCATNEIVVGFSGRAGAYVDQLALRCAPLRISGEPGLYSLSVGEATTIGPAGGDGGNLFPPIDCPAGQIATGTALRVGLAIDAFGLICAAPSLVFNR